MNSMDPVEARACARAVRMRTHSNGIAHEAHVDDDGTDGDGTDCSGDSSWLSGVSDDAAFSLAVLMQRTAATGVIVDPARARARECR